MYRFMSLFMVWAALAQPAGTGPVEQPTTGIGDLAKDYEIVSGKWERYEQIGPFGVLGTVHIVKEIDSQSRRERVTRYDSEEKVVMAHEVDFRLDRGLGPTRVFTFTNLEQVEGPNKGQKSEGTQTYLYDVNGDRFVEVWGLLVSDGDRPVEVIEWNRVKDKPQQDATARENDE